MKFEKIAMYIGAVAGLLIISGKLYPKMPDAYVDPSLGYPRVR